MSGHDQGPNHDLNRRHLFKLIASGGVITSSAALLSTACSSPAHSNQTEVPLDDLPLDQRVRVLHRELPVEVVRTAEGVRARSLWCTHMGCEISWSEVEGQYLCPCHEGVFNRDGFPIKGPPPRRLTELPVVLTENKVVIGSPE